MKIISYNCNGIKQSLTKPFELSPNILEHLIAYENPDVICLQEIKTTTCHTLLQPLLRKFPSFSLYVNSGIIKGHHGVAVLTKITPSKVDYKVDKVLAEEGRIIALHFNDIVLLNCYFPNTRRGPERLQKRLQWESTLREYIIQYDKVIITGDFNVCPSPLQTKLDNNAPTFFEDISYNEEYESFLTFIYCGLIDIWRKEHPTERKYTNKCGKTLKWRIDLFLVSYNLQRCVKRTDILENITTSDHTPILLDISV